ncbi:hypothetical protein V496_05516 [Pseudogymnoascus sp. VKM F-4515 (FW-2607)]|nr:hypothetical protein V496_05516 [Pseudogymnoascus sp. VKM F-4515 (FW-2607)]
MANDFDADFFIDPDSPGLFVNQLGECDGLFGFDAVDDVSAASTSLKGSADSGSVSMHRASVVNGEDGASVSNGLGIASISEPVYGDDASEDDDGDDGLYGNQALMSVDEDDDEEEIFEEEDPPAGADDPLSWRVDHSTGDHKLKEFYCEDGIGRLRWAAGAGDGSPAVHHGLRKSSEWVEGGRCRRRIPSALLPGLHLHRRAAPSAHHAEERALLRQCHRHLQGLAGAIHGQGPIQAAL